jgi:hypothetical protein
MLFGKTPFDRVYHRSTFRSSNPQIKRYKALARFVNEDRKYKRKFPRIRQSRLSFE